MPSNVSIDSFQRSGDTFFERLRAGHSVAPGRSFFSFRGTAQERQRRGSTHLPVSRDSRSRRDPRAPLASIPAFSLRPRENGPIPRRKSDERKKSTTTFRLPRVHHHHAVYAGARAGFFFSLCGEPFHGMTSNR